MTPFFHDDHLTLYGGDCREVLRELPDESVHCVVTSPPYWGLRDYGTASWDGGDPECDHKQETPVLTDSTSTLGVPADGGARRIGTNNATVVGKGVYKVTCGKCGARRIDSQLGLEATPEEFVANMVAVFREVRRVLRRDGTLWLNLGDSYAGSGKGAWSDDATREANRHRVKETYVPTRAESPTAGVVPAGLKPKDLVGIPWRVAFALQADGWYLRSDIIWAKPNPMPESVTDRPTKAHEYLFLLTRSPRYYYDAEAVREVVSGGTHSHGRLEARLTQPKANAGGPMMGGKGNGSFQAAMADLDPALGRNLRSVWNIATEPYPGAHFATFPRKLVEPCVKAGTSERGVCPECGAPWVRVVERTHDTSSYSTQDSIDRTPPRHSDPHRALGNAYRQQMAEHPPETTGWRPSCSCDCALADHAAPVPAVVLDPFAGSGTTLFVAQALGRRGVGIDLSPDYLKQALERNRQTPLGLVG